MDRRGGEVDAMQGQEEYDLDGSIHVTVSLASFQVSLMKIQ